MESNLNSLDQKIIDELLNNGCMTVEELSKKLGAEKTIINYELYGPLKEYCSLDEECRWSILKDKASLVSFPFDESKYNDILLKGNLTELNEYLSHCGNDVLTTPHMLFVKPVISGIILANDKVESILNFLVSNGIDLNSQEYFKNRNDDLKGIDFCGGCICFPIYYYIQGKKRRLKPEEVEMYSYFVIKAREKGWKTGSNFPNNTKIQNLIYFLLANGHEELQPVYDALFSEIQINEREKVQETLEKEFEHISNDEVTDDSKNDSYNTVGNIEKSILDTTLFEDTKIILNAVAINGFVDPSLLSENTSFGKNIRNNLEKLDCKTIDELIVKCGLTLGPIAGDVQYEFVKDDDIEESYISDELLEQHVSGFSNRTMNRLMMYGVRTYKDLLDLNLEEFRQKRGVGNTVIDEIKTQIAKIKAGTANIEPEEPMQDDLTESTLEQDIINNPEISIQSKLPYVVPALLKLYKDRPKEQSVEKIFINNPKYREYYDLLLDNSMEIFGCELGTYLSKMGLIAINDDSFSHNDDITNSNDYSLVENVPTESADNNANCIDEKDGNITNAFVSEELVNIPAETQLCNEEYLEEDLVESDRESDEENMFWLLDSLFNGKKVNLKSIEGTSLHRKLQECANRNNISFEYYLRINGYTIDNEAIEKYKTTYNRVYQRIN